MIPLSELEREPGAVYARFAKKQPVADYANQLGVGAAGRDAFVFGRDPEDDEEPDEPGDVPYADTCYADISGLRGFYVRTVEDALLAKVPWDGRIESGARLAATSTWIAAECEDAIALVPRADAQLSCSSIAARWLAAAPDGSRVLVESPDGLALLELGATVRTEDYHDV